MNNDNITFDTKLSTSIEESKKLVELGISSSTADCVWQRLLNGEKWGEWVLFPYPYKDWNNKNNTEVCQCIPAWSLHRLIRIAHNKDLALLSVENPFKWLVHKIEKMVNMTTINPKYLNN